MRFSFLYRNEGIKKTNEEIKKKKEDKNDDVKKNRSDL